MRMEDIFGAEPGHPRTSTPVIPRGCPDLGSQLDTLRLLKDGWFDGKGLAPTSAGLDWLTQAFKTQVPSDIVAPYVYPVAEGGVRLEWLFGREDVSIEIDLSHRAGDWHQLNLDTDDEETRSLDLNDGADWAWLVARLRAMRGNEP